MIQEIRDYINQFEHNQPIFRVEPHSDAEIKLTLLRNAPKPDPGDDPVKYLVNKHFHQTFDGSKGRWKVNAQEIETTVLSSVYGLISKFVERNADAAKPRQTKIWRWLNRGRNTSPPVQEGLFLLFKYVANHCDLGSMKYTNPDETHLNNALLILEAMQKRYS